LEIKGHSSITGCQLLVTDVKHLQSVIIKGRIEKNKIRKTIKRTHPYSPRHTHTHAHTQKIAISHVPSPCPKNKIKAQTGAEKGKRRAPLPGCMDEQGWQGCNSCG
jgi:hypothetical protein